KRPDQIKAESIPRHETEESQFKQHPDPFHFCVRGRGPWLRKLESLPKGFTSRMSCASPKACNPRFIQKLERFGKTSSDTLCNTVRTCSPLNERDQGVAKKIETGTSTNTKRQQKTPDWNLFQRGLSDVPQKDETN